MVATLNRDYPLPTLTDLQVWVTWATRPTGTLVEWDWVCLRGVLRSQCARSSPGLEHLTSDHICDRC
jgi:hypothetical protein